jgi:hypothetical protein
MKKTSQLSSASPVQVRKPAPQLLNLDGLPIIRDLGFYREAEERLFANRNPDRGGLFHLSQCRTER